jgi:hypothetical protein
MQQSLHLENLTGPTDEQDARLALGKGLVLALENGLKGKVKLYRGDYPIKSVDRRDKVARKLFVTETIELGATQARLAEALDLSRQTLHNYQEVKKHFGVRGLIHGYRLSECKDLRS